LKKQQIDAKPVFDSFIQSDEGNIRGILVNIQDHSTSSTDFTVNTFDPSEWKGIRVHKSNRWEKNRSRTYGIISCNANEFYRQKPA
jgi:hypothetical protein